MFVFDSNAYLARKNPLAVIAAFQRAHPAGDGSVGLVLKTMNGRADSDAWRQFVAVCAADPRITLLDRTLAEAMLLGKPVVGTNFSDNTDFLTQDTGYPVKWTRRAVAPGEYPFIEPADQAWWADPDIPDAARQLSAARTAAGSPWAVQLPQQVAEQFSPEAIDVRMRALLRQRFEALAAGTCFGGTGS